MSELNIQSSWIERLQYVPAKKGVTMPEGTNGFLVAKTENGTWAWAVPSYLAGLIVAHRSAGRALRLLVMGKYQSTRLS